MLYIHQLKDLTAKSADIESVTVIRELKKKTPPPITVEKLTSYFSLLFVSESEKAAMQKAYTMLEPVIKDIIQLAHLNDPELEPINLQRAEHMLAEIPQPLLNNMNYAQEVSNWQQDFSFVFAPILNSIPQLRSYQEKQACNQQLNAIFEKILRNNEFAFNYKDIIYEAQTSRLNDLTESMGKGFFFHIHLEEELRKVDFNAIKKRISSPKLEAVERIQSRLLEIKKGVDAAYDINMRMITWALATYSYIKWFREQNI